MTTPRLGPRDWVPTDAFVQRIATDCRAVSRDAVRARLGRLVDQNRTIHELDCVNLNPAANVMSPAAEMLLATSLGTRPSLGHPGAKYEMGLEAVEQIEVIAAELAAEVFDAPYAEVRIGSGALANLYAFMACCEPGDAIVVPPASIAGHVTHNEAGAAGLYGLAIHEAPIDAANYTVDVEALGELVRRVEPRMITIGASLNLTHHPVSAIRELADDVGATVLFDAAHLSGLIAGGAWPNPLHEGAHIMTMSTYKSLAGPAAGLLVTTDAAIAERVDAIAFPGLTANFDAANTAALAMTLLDWQDLGSAYAAAMLDTATALATHLLDAGLPVLTAPDGVATRSHAFAVRGGRDRRRRTCSRPAPPRGESARVRDRDPGRSTARDRCHSARNERSGALGNDRHRHGHRRRRDRSRRARRRPRRDRRGRRRIPTPVRPHPLLSVTAGGSSRRAARYSRCG